MSFLDGFSDVRGWFKRKLGNVVGEIVFWGIGVFVIGLVYCLLFCWGGTEWEGDECEDLCENLNPDSTFDYRNCLRDRCNF
jgi:hypothetical protein